MATFLAVSISSCQDDARTATREASMKTATLMYATPSSSQNWEAAQDSTSTTNSALAMLSSDARIRFPLISNTFLKVDVPLRHRPEGSDLSQVVSRGQAVALLGKAKDSKGQWWYRVIWSSKQGDFVGWIKADNTDFPNDKLAPLRPPPPCAKYLTAVPGAKKWVNPKEQDLVVLTDLYRLTPQGTYPAAKFKVLVNGKQDPRWTRPIKPSNGQLLLGRGAAINMGKIVANSELGYALETTSPDRVALFTTIYAVPDGCEFKTDD